MINILQIMPEFGLAGAETMCETLCCQLQNSGRYNVFVVSLFDVHSPITDRMEKRGIHIKYLNKKSGFDLSIIAKLYHVMKDNNINIVHTHRYVMQYAVPAAIFAGVKVRVHTVHNIATKEVSGYRRILAYFFYKYCKVIPISISSQVQSTVIDEYHLTATKTPIVYNGIDLSKCPIKQNYLISDTFKIVHIGRFNLQKNHRTIISAAKILKSKGLNFSINFIGGSGDEDELRQKVIQDNLQDVISFSGLQSNVYPFLEVADCFILPSLYEGLPITIIEAMGCALPIIASAVGGVPDMIKNDDSGILIQPTVDNLVEAIIRLMHDNILRERLGRKALLESKRFSAEQMYKGYSDLYDKLMLSH